MPHTRAKLIERNGPGTETELAGLQRIADRVGIIADDVVALDLRPSRHARDKRAPSPYNIPERRPSHCMASSSGSVVQAGPDGTYSSSPYPVDPTPVPEAKPLPATAEFTEPWAATPDGLTGMAAVLAIEAAMTQPCEL